LVNFCVFVKKCSPKNKLKKSLKTNYKKQQIKKIQKKIKKNKIKKNKVKPKFWAIMEILLKNEFSSSKIESLFKNQNFEIKK